MKKFRIFTIAIAVSLCWLQMTTTQAQQKSIVETAVSAGSFNTLVAAVKAAGLVDTLNSHTQFTVFAPTDEAFAKLPPGTLEALLRPENKQQFVDILTYHVLSGRVKAKDAYDLDFATTVNGQRAKIDFRGDGLLINEAQVVTPDIECTNGIIHVIDSVILPSSQIIPAVAKGAEKFNTLLAAVGAAGLGEALSSKGPFTVFAPTDEAFASLPEGTVETLLKPENKEKLIDTLKYHVLPGRVYSSDAVKLGRAATLLGPDITISLSSNGAMVNESSLVAKDIEAANGVIHVINAVLLPSQPSPSDVMSMIQDSIARGATAFNSGQHQECCDIYMQTMTSLLATGIQGADDHMMTSIRNAANNAQSMHDISSRAWALRRGLVSMYMSMGEMPKTITSNR